MRARLRTLTLLAVVATPALSSCLEYYDAPRVEPNFVARTPLPITYALLSRPPNQDVTCFATEAGTGACAIGMSRRILEGLDTVLGQQFAHSTGRADVFATFDMIDARAMYSRAGVAIQLGWRFSLRRRSGERLVEIRATASASGLSYVGVAEFAHLESAILEQIRSTIAEATACGQGSTLCGLSAGGGT